jgi:hypothetical protein
MSHSLQRVDGEVGSVTPEGRDVGRLPRSVDCGEWDVEAGEGGLRVCVCPLQRASQANRRG